MKNLCVPVLLFVIFVNTNDSTAQRPRNDIKGDYLLETQWGGNEKDFHLFYKYSPNNQPLGCHSIAIAQVLFYYKLAPFGKVSYKCSNGFKINEDFSTFPVDWDKISTRLTDSTTQEKIDATAFYTYSVACIVQKDFGTSQYVGIESSNNHKSQIEKHFKCEYESYSFKSDSSLSDLFDKEKSITSIIEREIDAQRPIGFYYDRPNNGGHAIVIDGYTIEENNFYVHANFGWSGNSDGWYLLPEDLPKDTKAIIILTIKPI
jgi:hypothetical protein